MGKGSKAKAGGGKAPVQKSLEQTGQLPLLKKPAECVGKLLGVISVTPSTFHG